MWTGSEGGGDRNTHLLGTVFETLGEGGVGRRAGLGAGAELDPVVGELAVESTPVAVALSAVVGHGHGEVVARHLRLDGLVGWHGSDGDCDGRVCKERIRCSYSEPGFPARVGGRWQTWRGELAPFVLGQLQNVEGPLDHLDLVVHPGIVQ